MGVFLWVSGCLRGNSSHVLTAMLQGAFLTIGFPAQAGNIELNGNSQSSSGGQTGGAVVQTKSPGKVPVGQTLPEANSPASRGGAVTLPEIQTGAGIPGDSEFKAIVGKTKHVADTAQTSTGANGAQQAKNSQDLSTTSVGLLSAAEWHCVHLRLSGSMCIACLKELSDNLQFLSGVDRVHIERPQSGIMQSISPDVNNWAQGIIIYDGKRMQLDQLRNTIRQNGYHSYHIVDRILEHEPAERDVKF